MDQMTEAYVGTEESMPEQGALLVGRYVDVVDPITAARELEEVYAPNNLQNPSKVAGTAIDYRLSVKVTAVGSEVNYLNGQVRSTRTNYGIVLSSLMAMLAVQIASLADNNWEVKLPWLFVVLGYAGLLITIVIYAEAVKSRIRTSTVRFPVCRGKSYCVLQMGNQDNEGVPGFQIPISGGRQDVVKLCCLLASSVRVEVMGTTCGLLFMISFLVHYLGLRSVQWWVSVGELAVCFFMVGFRTIASRTPSKFSPSKFVYDTDLRSVGVISSSARKQARFKNPEPGNGAKDVRAHFGTRDMGPQTQGDVCAALLAVALKKWEEEKLQRAIRFLGLFSCRTANLSATKRVLIHVGGTGVLSKEGYIRPSGRQVWAQEFNVDQVRSQSLVGWCVNGLMRNENLELVPEFRGCITESIHIPASDSIVDWWLRSEGTNDWKANCNHLQWGGVLPLAILLCALDTSEDSELEDAVAERFKDAQRTAGTFTRAVAKELEAALANIVEE
jgi:hypothetical protein